MTDGLLASDPWAQANPKQALTLLELFVRALVAQKDKMVRAKKINVRRMSAERINTKPKVTARRLI
jgi:hypothetical protein